MDYSNLFRRAFDTVWTYKFLILLGLLAAFTGSQSSALESRGGGPLLLGGPLTTGPDEATFVAPAVAVLLFALLLIAGILLYLVGTIARGALIAGVDVAEREEPVTLGHAWRSGWRRAVTLVGIGLLPALPLLVSGVLGLSGFFFYRSGAPAWVETLGVGWGAAAAILSFLMLLLAALLGLLQTFANRAAMLEEHGVVAAYRRGAAVLADNLGQAVVIFVLQVLVTVLLMVTGVAVGLCFLTWPLLWVLEGFMVAVFSAVWTLAWQAWTADSVTAQAALI